MKRLASSLALAAAAALAPGAGLAATYTINITSSLNLANVAAAASGDTVFRTDPATGAVTALSGAGRRLSTAIVRSQVQVNCRRARVTDTLCDTQNVTIVLNALGASTGRARALRNFTIAAGTATIAVPLAPNGSTFQLAPVGNSSTKTFFIGADFPIAGDDSALASGAGETLFSAAIVDPATGLPLSTDTDKGLVRAYRSLSITNTSALNFGRIQLPSTGSSTITLSASTGNRTSNGKAFLYPTPAPTLATFTVAGEGGQQFSLSVPTALTLSGPTDLAVKLTKTAVPAPRLSGAIGSPGTYSFNIGGSLVITSTTPPGAYSGVITVSLDYN